jgi:PqqD family protein of HPr-rel-A system
MTEAGSIASPPRPDIETAFVGGEAVLLNVGSGQVYALNPSASAVWLLLVDGVRTADALALELSDIVEVAPDVLLPDVEAALADFVRLGLLEPADDAEPAAQFPMPLLPPPDP